jgi:hypothetical protein
MEVTKWLKPSISVSRIGDSASVQAATRVNAEQASHGVVQVKSVIVRGALVNLQYSLRYPRSEPNPRFRFDPRLTPLDAEPPDSLFADQSAA